MKKSVYIETTIPSFVVSRLSRDTIIAGQQVATNLFWETERQNYDFYTVQRQKSSIFLLRTFAFFAVYFLPQRTQGTQRKRKGKKQFIDVLQFV